MEPHYRVILTRKSDHPNRETLSQADKAVGEVFLQNFDAEWAGTIAVEDEFRLGVQWLVREDKFEQLSDYFESNILNDFKIRVFKVDDEEPEEILISEF